MQQHLHYRKMLLSSSMMEAGVGGCSRQQGKVSRVAETESTLKRMLNKVNYVMHLLNMRMVKM